MSTSIKSLIDTLLCTNKKKSWEMHIITNWKDIIGSLHTQVTVEKIEHSIITLGVYDSCLLQELYLLSGLLLKRINQNLEKPYIKQVRLKMAMQKPKISVPYEPKNTKVEKQYPLSVTQKEALAIIADRELQEVLTHFFVRCNQESE